jgi:hypothetical protein
VSGILLVVVNNIYLLPVNLVCLNNMCLFILQVMGNNMHLLFCRLFERYLSNHTVLSVFYNIFVLLCSTFFTFPWCKPFFYFSGINVFENNELY